MPLSSCTLPSLLEEPGSSLPPAQAWLEQSHTLIPSQASGWLLSLGLTPHTWHLPVLGTQIQVQDPDVVS